MANGINALINRDTRDLKKCDAQFAGSLYPGMSRSIFMDAGIMRNQMPPIVIGSLFK
jgi:hypothetical protein